MKRALLTIAAAAGFALAAAAPASAYVDLGPCLLRAQVPVPANPSGAPQGEGQITNCDSGILGLTNHTLRLQSCIQVHQSLGWATKRETCIDSGTFRGSGVNEFPTAYQYASPREYRTWVWGCADGTCKTYVSGLRQW